MFEIRSSLLLVGVSNDPNARVVEAEPRCGRSIGRPMWTPDLAWSRRHSEAEQQRVGVGCTTTTGVQFTVAKPVVNSMGNGTVTNSNSDVVIVQGMSLDLVASDPILTPHVVDTAFNCIMPQANSLLNTLPSRGVVGHAGPFEAGVSNTVVGPWFQDALVASDVPGALPAIDSSLVDGCICSNFNAPAVNNSVMLVISPLKELSAKGAVS
ncbi:hypothetical protein MA16_Dca012967 [Dendrobium catenatum]|uniref:Uncharacterized protein n=1 Tax=Dendrobium catenatum TaxID=906689 RepID=A0A2I0W1V3_9ASPA|nr:hypothetical protein MA16_Dca012967 [Dendrobium catenatum]